MSNLDKENGEVQRAEEDGDDDTLDTSHLSPSHLPQPASPKLSSLPAPTPTPIRIFSSTDPGRYALLTLTMINLLNYIDRYVPSATKDLFKADLQLSDTETSVPLTAFVFVYMLTSPIFSYLTDNMGYARNRVICAGVVIWSVATAAGALAIDFWTLLASRSLVGVGEAAYATIAPALLSDFYLPAQRNTVLSFFYLAIPVGAALGYAIGGQVGNSFGWRVAFLVCGVPGLLVAIMCLYIHEPVRGAMDVGLNVEEGAVEGVGVEQDRREQQEEDYEDEETIGAEEFEAPVLGGPPVRVSTIHPRVPSAVVVRVGESSGGSGSAQQPVNPNPPTSLPASTSTIPPPSWPESARLLLKNPCYLYCTVGLTLVTFGAGGLADWFPSWMHRVHDISEDTASTVVGAITALGGIIGTGLGSWLGEKAKGKIAAPYLGVSGIGMIVTVTCGWLIMVGMWLYTGPINALTVNCVSASLRVRAFSFQILFSHALGDAISPTIVGAISDATDSIRTAVLIIPAALSAACAVWLIGWQHMARQESVTGQSFDGYAPPSTLASVQHSRVGSRRESRRASLNNALLRNDWLGEGGTGGGGGVQGTGSLNGTHKSALSSGSFSHGHTNVNILTGGQGQDAGAYGTAYR